MAEDDTEGEFVCEVCDQCFDSEAELERHVHDVGLVDWHPG